MPDSRVVLINPGKCKQWAGTHPPMHLGSIAAYLEQNGTEVHIVDEVAGQDVEAELKRLDPHIVGVTATTPLAPDAYRAAAIARRMGKYTVMGGKHAMIMTEEALQHVDTVVLGEGERIMLDIVNGLRDRIVHGQHVQDIDDLPSPAWHLLDMEFYLKARDHSSNHLMMFPKGSRIGSLLTMRGCPYSCVFCYNSWRDTPVRYHSAERVFNDIRFLIDNYNMTGLFFMDDDLFSNRKRFRELGVKMIQTGTVLPWGCQASVNSFDRELLTLAKNSGCMHVGMGFESGSPRILNLLKKGRTTVEKNREAAELCKEVGVNSFATFMVGNPTETVDDVMMTKEFIKTTPLDGIGVLITTPFPGTEIWNWSKEHKLIPENVDWSIFTCGNVSIPACDTISPGEVERLRDELLHQFYPVRLSQHLNLNALWHALRNPKRVLSKMRYLKFS